MIIPDANDGVGTALIPPNAPQVTHGGKTSSSDAETQDFERQIPGGRPPTREPSLADDTEDTMLIGESGEEDDLFWTHWKDGDSVSTNRQYPTLHCVNLGILICDEKWFGGHRTAPIDSSRCMYNYPSTTLTSQELSDRDILDHFGPSRLPPRASFRMPLALGAIEKEITDLLKEQHWAPPAMIEISLGYPQYRHLARVPSTLVAKRRSASLYKDRLCARGEAIPLSAKGFMSSPTSHRSTVKIVCALASSQAWQIKAMDISHDFLQSENLPPEDRIIVTPPEMATLPGDGELPPLGTDLKAMIRSRHGLLPIRPLYGGRDAPMRWRITLSKGYAVTDLHS